LGSYSRQTSSRKLNRSANFFGIARDASVR
jgi:hypothetical protein